MPEIAAADADLVLLPELFACGYNIGDDVVQRAEPLKGLTLATMSDLARTFGTAIHYGWAERDGNRLYNAALGVSPGGDILCHQRKLAIPPGSERTHFTPGTGCDLFEYRGFRIATLICYDAEFPETVRHVAALGADLVLVPTALAAEWPWVAHTMMPTRAYENGVYLAYANSAGVENGMTFLGSSVIAGPDGTEVARAGTEPEILYANLDKTRVSEARQTLPYLEDRHLIRL